MDSNEEENQHHVLMTNVHDLKKENTLLREKAHVYTQREFLNDDQDSEGRNCRAQCKIVDIIIMLFYQ